MSHLVSNQGQPKIILKNVKTRIKSLKHGCHALEFLETFEFDLI